VTVADVVGLAVSLALMVYLAYALLRGEDL
jgi:K+-transporting ATPase KdpF subunit